MVDRVLAVRWLGVRERKASVRFLEEHMVAGGLSLLVFLAARLPPFIHVAPSELGRPAQVEMDRADRRIWMQGNLGRT